MGYVTDPPAEVWVLTYHWSRRNASGARREAFLRQVELERRIDALYADTEQTVTEPRVFTLNPGSSWDEVQVYPPRPASLEGS